MHEIYFENSDAKVIRFSNGERNTIKITEF